MRKVAVVGTGAAGLGVLSSLIDVPDQEIHVFERGAPVDVPGLPAPSAAGGEPSRRSIEAYYDEIYRAIRRTQARQFPPPKTHFARPLAKFEVDGKPRLFKSEHAGGLTNFWGGTALPFTDRELAGWPVTYAQLRPYYERIASLAGISGEPDALNRYFPEDFVNRPPMRILGAFEGLRAKASDAQSATPYQVYSGINRCMLETRPGSPRACVACGECLAGCFKSSIYSADQTIRGYIERPHVRSVRGRVVRVDGQGNLELEQEGTHTTLSGFDRIYLAAGCPNTTEIVLRSTGAPRVAPMQDNAVHIFPIVHYGLSGLRRYAEDYLSINNLILCLEPTGAEHRFAQALIYANFDYLWRYNAPSLLWTLGGWSSRFARNKLFWARLYVDGADSQAYDVQLREDRLAFTYAREANTEVLGDMLKSVRRAVNGGGYWVPPVRPVLQRSNSHYASTLPYGGELVPVDDRAQVLPNVFVCDSSVFPSLPAVPLTFTIMANAARIATESLPG